MTSKKFMNKMVIFTLHFLLLSSLTQSLPLGLMVYQSGEPSSNVLVVPDHFRKIQHAINNASDGDVVFVKRGIYFESVHLNKSVSLVGESWNLTTIDSDKTSHVITVSADNCLVCEFTIQNGGMDVPANNGIHLNNVNNNVICRNLIIGNFVGAEGFGDVWFSFTQKMSKELI